MTTTKRTNDWSMLLFAMFLTVGTVGGWYFGAMQFRDEAVASWRWREANGWKVEAFDDLFRRRSGRWRPTDKPYVATDDVEAELPDHYWVPQEAITRRQRWNQRVEAAPAADAREGDATR